MPDYLFLFRFRTAEVHVTILVCRIARRLLLFCKINRSDVVTPIPMSDLPLPAPDVGVTVGCSIAVVIVWAAYVGLFMRFKRKPPTDFRSLHVERSAINVRISSQDNNVSSLLATSPTARNTNTVSLLLEDTSTPVADMADAIGRPLKIRPVGLSSGAMVAHPSGAMELSSWDRRRQVGAGPAIGNPLPSLTDPFLANRSRAVEESFRRSSLEHYGDFTTNSL
jgi:hypothetical protein